MRRSIVAAVLLCAVSSGVALAFDTYDVTGVATGDTLTLREQPEDGGKPSDWKEVGKIPGDAKRVLGTGRSLQASGQRWSEVSYGGKLGWVNAKHLQGVLGETEPKSVTFSCGGTEPFWSVSLGESSADYSDREIEAGKKMAVDQIIVAQGRAGVPALYRLKDDQGARYQAVVSQREWCTDGMSDFDYAFDVTFTSDTSLMQGCCTIKR